MQHAALDECASLPAALGSRVDRQPCVHALLAVVNVLARVTVLARSGFVVCCALGIGLLASYKPAVMLMHAAFDARVHVAVSGSVGTACCPSLILCYE